MHIPDKTAAKLQVALKTGETWEMCFQSTLVAPVGLRTRHIQVCTFKSVNRWCFYLDQNFDNYFS